MKPLGIEGDGVARTEPTKQRVRAADRIVQALEGYGIDRVFGIPGGTISPIYDALYDSSIRMVTCQHECMAVYMAAGYARATGRPAVVAVTSGPGVLNALTGIAAAFLDEVPVLVLAGETSTQHIGRAPLQEGTSAGLDVANLCRSVTRYHETLWRPERAVAMIGNAFHVMERRPRGPVFLQLPVNVLQSPAPETMNVAVSACAPSLDHSRCNRIAKILMEARAPALFLGVGARDPEIRKAVIELAEVLHCSVITDAEGKGVFPESHPLSMGIFGVGATGGAHQYLRNECDVVLTIGARLDDTTTGSYDPDLRAPDVLIQLDHDFKRLCRSYPADIAVCGEILPALQHISSAISAPSCERFVSRDEAVRRASSSSVNGFVSAVGNAPFDPRIVPRFLHQVWPDAVFTADIGNHLLFALQNLTIDTELGFCVSFGLGGMGGGIGTAMGLQLGRGSSRQVISICGDGGTLMVGNELATCVVQEIPLVLAVFNDGGLGMVRHGFERVYGRQVDLVMPQIDLVGYARSMGADAIRVETFEDFERAAGIARRGPLLLDIPINSEVRAHNPRDGAHNFPARAG